MLTPALAMSANARPSPASTAPQHLPNAVHDLFGINPSSHSHPWRTLRVHICRLSGLTLWNVAKYAAGRGADKVCLFVEGWLRVVAPGLVCSVHV